MAAHTCPVARCRAGFLGGADYPSAGRRRDAGFRRNILRDPLADLEDVVTGAFVADRQVEAAAGTDRQPAAVVVPGLVRLPDRRCLVAGSAAAGLPAAAWKRPVGSSHRHRVCCRWSACTTGSRREHAGEAAGQSPRGRSRRGNGRKRKRPPEQSGGREEGCGRGPLRGSRRRESACPAGEASRGRGRWPSFPGAVPG